MRRSLLSAVYKLMKARFLNKRIPLIVGWSVTDRCNWQCRYCIRKERSSKEITTREAYVIIDELCNSGTYSINFTGGEPLLRDDIKDLVFYAKKRNIRVSISSNGSLLPQRIDEINGVNSLILSYDGPQEVHDKQRQSGAYRDVVAAVDLAKKHNVKVNLHTVLTKNNIGNIDSILDFAGFFEVMVNFAVVEFIPFSKEEEIKELLPPIDRYTVALQRLIFEKKKGNEYIGNSLLGLTYLSGWPRHKKMDCCAGRIYCRIESNGDLFPCANLILRSKPLNYSSTGFRKAFKELKRVNCDSCWCDTRIEMNNVYSLRISSMLDVKRAHKL